MGFQATHSIAGTEPTQHYIHILHHDQDDHQAVGIFAELLLRASAQMLWGAFAALGICRHIPPGRVSPSSCRCAWPQPGSPNASHTPFLVQQLDPVVFSRTGLMSHYWRRQIHCAPQIAHGMDQPRACQACQCLGDELCSREQLCVLVHHFCSEKSTWLL